MNGEKATRVGLRRGIIDMPHQPGANREGRSDPGPQRPHNKCLGRANIAHKAQTLLPLRGRNDPFGAAAELISKGSKSSGHRGHRCRTATKTPYGGSSRLRVG